MTSPAHLPPLLVRRLGRRDYRPVWEAMRKFTASRQEATVDELWLVEHPAVLTLGVNGQRRHLLTESSIPVIHTDRGGQVTYHGPGQVIAYVLIDLRRREWGLRSFVTTLEQSLVDLLVRYGVRATLRPEAPGVYVQGAKIAALGLRIRQGCCYHGIAFNVAMDLEPFSWVNPCGYPALEVTDLRSLGVSASMAEVEDELTKCLALRFGYTPVPSEDSIFDKAPERA